MFIEDNVNPIQLVQLGFMVDTLHVDIYIYITYTYTWVDIV
jgi:hypothetical protein